MNKLIVSGIVGTMMTFPVIASAQDAEQKTQDLETRLQAIEQKLDAVSFIKDWEFHGYGNVGLRYNDDLSSTSTTFGKGDYFLGITGTSENANQVEWITKKKFATEGGAWGNFIIRSEYGNGDSYLYSSSGSEHDNGKANYEVKEAYVELGGLSILPENASLWAGRKFHNRNATALSGEFYKQSSGVGFGYSQDKLALAVVATDPGAENGKDSANLLPIGKSNKTITSVEGEYGFNVPGGSLTLAGKFYTQANADITKTKDEEGNWVESKNSNAAETGFGVGVIYNTKFYGMNGWAQHAVTYGTGIGANAKGLNFGQWVDGADEDAKTFFFSSYGMGNLTDKIQLGTEVTFMSGDTLYGQESLQRGGISLRPSFKVNDNFRFELGATVGMQTLDNPGAWGKSEDTEIRIGVSAAPTFTINSDYYGRPQIQPFVTYFTTNDKSGFGGEYGDDDSAVVFGVKGEVWF